MSVSPRSMRRCTYGEDVRSGMEKILRYPAEKLPKIAISAAGAGVRLQQWISTTPGISSVFMSSTTTHSCAATLDIIRPYLSKSDDEGISFVSRDVASALAKAAFHRAIREQMGGDIIQISMHTIGIGITGALKSSSPKKWAGLFKIKINCDFIRGEHNIFACAVNLVTGYVVDANVILAKGKRGRVEEDAIASLCAYTCMMRLLDESTNAYMNVEWRTIGDFRDIVYPFVIDRIPQENCLQNLLQGKISHVLVVNPFRVSEPNLDNLGLLILSGSFNPPHEGHRELAQKAADVANVARGKIVYELCCCNIDKAPLTQEEIERRLHLLSDCGMRSILVTRLPLFMQKSQIAKGANFAVGYDTFARLLDSKYYDSDDSRVARALATLGCNGAKFIVAGRLVGETFCDSDALFGKSSNNDASLLGFTQKELKEMFISLRCFRNDITSTALRQATNEPSC